jgi:hypothetical protein
MSRLPNIIYYVNTSCQLMNLFCNKSRIGNQLGGGGGGGGWWWWVVVVVVAVVVAAAAAAAASSCQFLITCQGWSMPLPEDT